MSTTAAPAPAAPSTDETAPLRWAVIIVTAQEDAEAFPHQPILIGTGRALFRRDTIATIRSAAKRAGVSPSGDDAIYVVHESGCPLYLVSLDGALFYRRLRGASETWRFSLAPQ